MIYIRLIALLFALLATSTTSYTSPSLQPREDVKYGSGISVATVTTDVDNNGSVRREIEYFTEKFSSDSCAHVEDYAALMALYLSTDGDNWSNNAGWGTDCNICTWYGVQCDTLGKVMNLFLVNNGLSGSIPPEIGKLTNLVVLLLDFNDLSGPIPSEIGNLSNLRFLIFTNNQLSGPIPPEIGNLSNLNWLLLNENRLSDSIPPEIGNLTNVNQLLLNSNELSGTIPPQLANLSNISNLYLDHNNLSGCIPLELSALCGIDVRLNNNDCLSHNADFALFCSGQACELPKIPGCGTCDDGIQNQDETDMDCGGVCEPCPPCPETPDYEALMALYQDTGGDDWTSNTGWGADCDVCNWYGVQCDSIGRVINLFLVENALTNSLPVELGDLEYLEALFLDFNELSGALPGEIGNLSNLQFLILSNNQLSGPIPSQIGNLANLKWLLLDENQFTDSIPKELANLSNLGKLNLSNNDLSGCIPAEMAVFCGKDVQLNENQCLSHGAEIDTFCLGLPCALPMVAGCGTCDDNIQNQDETGIDCGGGCSPCPICPDTPDYDALMALYDATNGHNWVDNTGWGESCDICNWYGVHCDSLGRVINLFLISNDLQNAIPSEIGDLEYLEALLLDFNDLSGSLPPQIGNLSNLKFLILANNQLSGPIPPEIGNLSSLEWLLLNENQLSDSIPGEMGNLTKVNQLLLNSNQLSGSIPAELALLSNIRNLYLDHNALSGCIPSELLALCGTDVRLNDNPCLSHDANFSIFCSGDECELPRIPGCGTCEDGIWNQDETDVDCGGVCDPCPPCPDVPDYEALMAIYDATDGDHWNVNTGWGEDCDVCNWFGVQCDTTGRVNNLFLVDNGLRNALPQELGNLENLKALVLDFNEISGALPAEVGNLIKLEFLILANNQLSGPIPPEIGNLQNLKWLLLNENQLTESIPGELGNLANINQLLLNSNELSGPIPGELAQLPNIRNLYLDHNNLSDCIPEVMTALCGVDVRLNDNQCLSHNGDFSQFCSGVICELPLIPGCGACDDGVKNQDEEDVDCGGVCTPCPPCRDVEDYDALMALYNATDGDNWSNNRGWGEDCDVCNWFGLQCDTSNRLVNIFLVNNGLVGTIPPEIGNLEFLEALLLDFNQLSGEIPSEMGNLSNLEFIILTNNQLSGPIPNEIGNLSNLNWLLLNENQLSGSIPKEIGNLVKVTQLLLNSNQLSGPIPREITKLPISTLYLDNNNLSGCIPEEMMALCGKNVRLENNECLSHEADFGSFCSSTPCDAMEVCECTLPNGERSALMALYDSAKGESWINNTGWGEDCDVCDWYGVLCNWDGKVRVLALANNNLSGTIAAELSNLTNLQLLQLSSNELSGSIPSELGGLSNLVFLYLNQNQLEDTIPYTLGNLLNIRDLRLDDNLLNGTIPEGLGGLSNLFQLHLQNNDLSGCIPPSFTSLCSNNVDLTGNPCLSHNADFDLFCRGQACELPSLLDCGFCSDGIQNQDETDIDCGGVCGACAPDSTGQNVVGQDLLAEIRSVSTDERTGPPDFKNEGASLVDIYPNPTTDLITIEINRKGERSTVSIFDVVGRRIVAKAMDGSIDQIDMSQYQEGVYILVLEVGSERVVRKIVKE